MQLFGVKPRPVDISRSTLIQTQTQMMGYQTSVDLLTDTGLKTLGEKLVLELR